MIDEQYWREFAVKFARKRGVSNPEILVDIGQDAITKIYSLDLSRFKSQTEIERFVGRSVANMIRDWQRKEKLRTHAQLFEFTHHLNTTNRIESYFVDYVDSIIPRRVRFNTGQDALVDSIDWERIEPYNWHLKDCGDKSYARTWANGKHEYLHRLIVGGIAKIPKGATVNFINGDTLDCRRSNLAIGSTPLEEVL